MKLQHIIGADLSKESIDLYCHTTASNLKIENSITGFRQLRKWLREQKINGSKMMIVMEHTGLYSYQLEMFLHKHHFSFTKVSSLAIKRSLGLVRGKSDKVDAQRIARYGFEKKEMLHLTPSPDKVMERLALLHSTRQRLVRQRSGLKCAVNELGGVLKQSDLIIRSQRTLIKNLDEHIGKIETEIKDLTSKDEAIARNKQLLQSIKGVAEVLSTATIIKTRNFTRFVDARKFACFCGTAPFEHSSGKSIRRKTRVSHLADKDMKALLDRSANSAIQHDKELKAFYQRRVAMGKSKQSTINIVRNKIIYRMFAVIKRQTPFIENYLHTA